MTSYLSMSSGIIACFVSYIAKYHRDNENKQYKLLLQDYYIAFKILCALKLSCWALGKFGGHRKSIRSRIFDKTKYFRRKHGLWSGYSTNWGRVILRRARKTDVVIKLIVFLKTPSKALHFAAKYQQVNYFSFMSNILVC